MATTATFRIWRGDRSGGEFKDYATAVSDGMVVLDAVHQIQAEQANDLAVRWNCKAGKCGSCSAEVNGNPRLMCMTRLNQLDLSVPVTVEPMRAFPLVRDLVTDVSWNFAVKKSIRRFKPRPARRADGTWRMAQPDVERVQEFRKCIECFLCQDVCHVLRDHRVVRRVRRTPPSRLRGALWKCTRSTSTIGSRSEERARHRVLQHHEMLHQGVSGKHHDYRQRDHSVEGARHRSALRSRRQDLSNASACRMREHRGGAHDV